MKLKVEVSLKDASFSLDDLSADMNFSDLLALLELETDIVRSSMELFVDDKHIELDSCGSRSLSQMQCRDGGTVTVFNRLIAESDISPPQLAELQTLQRQLRSNPYQFSSIKQDNPPFAEAILAPTVTTFARYVVLQRHAQKRAELERVRRVAALAADPFNVEAQRALEEDIAKENIETLRQEAIEHMPESFGSVTMLYINVVVNGIPLKAFVDSGAQMTIMSVACAERCNITRLVDRRFQGLAVGVGSQKILGRVHMYALEVGGVHLPTSFSILENQPMDMLLGLDMLRRHQCVIDLRENVLVIGTTGTRTPFLGEQDIPDSARLTSEPGQDASHGPAQPVETELMGLGPFPLEQVRQALQQAGGDPQQAAALLLGSR